MNKRYQVGLQQFEHVLSSPHPWLFKGSNLLGVAKVLLERLWDDRKKLNEKLKTKTEFKATDPDSHLLNTAHSMEDQILLLVGFAYENYLRAIWIKKSGTKNYEDTKIPNEWPSYQIDIFFDRLSIEIEKEEREFLKLLSEFVIWKGRYPVPRNKAENGNSWGKGTSTSIFSKNFPGTCEWPDVMISTMNKLAVALKNESS
ncbi:MAG: hypothetical protein O3A82_16380 [Verrucomicrobia bacterium]|nr:hypothetical protein [Verrucomicrobiota bacterium]MDA0723956.1 hypothetical protein [Verrucomicrobiota bacterium]MDA1048488.1 hypothetical protein [Verrucomicrobiota bacterium]